MTTTTTICVFSMTFDGNNSNIGHIIHEKKNSCKQQQNEISKSIGKLIRKLRGC